MNISPVQNQLVYTTVRICTTNGQKQSIGTGFLLDINTKSGSEVFLVTNNHVVKDYGFAQIVFCAMNEKLEPDDNNHVTISINNFQNICIKHPHLDICLIKMRDIIQVANAQNKRIFFKSVGMDFFITDQMINQLSAIEDIITIGYPEGLIDSINNKPVVRKGITATSLSLNFEGREEFVIDAACFHGSSGSPVFLDQTGLYQVNTEHGITIGVKHDYTFIGMLRAVPAVTVKGELKVVDVPTDKELVSEAELMTNLGYVIKGKCIAEFVKQTIQEDNAEDAGPRDEKN